ncbi:hypothetical protein B484DRAFT_469162 [Ochromonadaceae sp. CCMP2298]|nr:hypothetical protein B484DRAFT_469162 [Ochromonadaceae sp. CCMP2298]
MVRIENLPPSYRSKVGIGMFLSALFTAKAGSHVEDFMFEHCFVAELKLLTHGVLLKVSGQQYFLQVRLKLYIMDTKQLEKSFDCSCVYCLFGCALCRHHGRWSAQSHLDKVIYNGHRVYLPLSHYFRPFGQSRNCYPKGYFTTTDTDFDNAEVQNVERDKLEQRRKREEKKEQTKGQANGAKSTDLEGRDGREIDLSLLGTALWYHICDFRLPRRFSPVKHAKFVADASSAAQKGALFHGIRKPSILLEVPFIDIEIDLCWEGFHTLYNISKNLLTTMKGERADSLGVRRYCTYTGTQYPCLQNGDEQDEPSPWVQPETEQYRLDGHINSVMIPMGYKNNFTVKNMFQQTGNLRGTDYITLVTVMMDYIVYISNNIPDAYKCFYRMLAHDVTDLQALFFSDTSINDLENWILETVAAH